jgi:hypothetical protein
MNFIEAIKYAKENNKSIKRIDWANGVILSIHDKSGYRDDEISVGHVAACALPLTATDILSDDWEIYNYG